MVDRESWAIPTKSRLRDEKTSMAPAGSNLLLNQIYWSSAKVYSGRKCRTRTDLSLVLLRKIERKRRPVRPPRTCRQAWRVWCRRPLADVRPAKARMRRPHGLTVSQCPRCRGAPDLRGSLRKTEPRQGTRGRRAGSRRRSRIVGTKPQQAIGLLGHMSSVALAWAGVRTERLRR